MSEKPNYYSIIPAHVRYDERLRANEKLMYGEITALSNANGHCWASNNYFAELYKVNKKTVSAWISNLVKYGHVNSHIIYKEGTNEVENRYLSINNVPIHKNMDTPIHKKVDTPIHKKTEDNNTRFNTTSNNKEEEEESVNAHLFYQQNIGRPSVMIDEQITDFLNDMQESVIVEAMKEAVLHNAYNFAYVKKVINDWLSKGVKTMDDLERIKNQSQSKQRKPKQPKQEDLPDWIKNDTRDYGF